MAAVDVGSAESSASRTALRAASASGCQVNALRYARVARVVDGAGCVPSRVAEQATLSRAPPSAPAGPGLAAPTWAAMVAIVWPANAVARPRVTAAPYAGWSVA